SGMTSQPNLNTLVEHLRFTERDTGMDFDTLRRTAEYWEGVRRYYLPFETGQLAPSADTYRHEMPGGQSTNLYQQAQSMGIGARPQGPQAADRAARRDDATGRLRRDAEAAQRAARPAGGRARASGAAALPARPYGLPRAPRQVLGRQRAADAGVLLRHGAGRR